MKTSTPLSVLVEGWHNLEASGVRRRDAAATLGVSEAQLVGALAAQGEARRLRPEWVAILESVPPIGRVMALTRNDGCVIEKIGTYLKPEFTNAHLGQVTGPEIDLRLFLHHWGYAFALQDTQRFSLEFFGRDGDAVHKIINRGESDRDVFMRIVERFAAPEADPVAAVPNSPLRTVADNEVDIPAYRQALAAMTNTHDFFGVTRRFKLAREQALRLGGETFANPVAPQSYRSLLERAAASQVPIMAFVGNDGCIEIHTGPVRHVVERGGYFNVIDPGFNLHLLESSVARTWIVRKPTQSGIISSLEVFDEAGNLIVQFFGERHGTPERKEWRGLLSTL